MDQAQRLRWDRSTPDSFIENLIVDCPQEFGICSDLDAHPLLVLKAFDVITKQVATNLTVSGRPRPSKHKKWFDVPCMTAHKDLMVALKQKPRAVLGVKNARKAYKCAVHNRKRQLREMAWEELSQASVLTNSSRFWGVVNSPVFDADRNSRIDCLVPAER